ncbi:MAG: HD domain-containing protein [Deltaproteobacteria bacterium]
MLSLPLDHEVFRSKPFAAVEEAARRAATPIYLVGGFWRDAILGRSKGTWDLDFCLPGGALAFGQRVARSLRAPFVVLDKDRGCGRLVCRRPRDGEAATFDFIDFRGKDLSQDLKRRDFTINTLAWALPLGRHRIVDPLGAMRDLQRKVIRVAGRRAFDEDPLRILRAYSLSALLGFRIEAPTRVLMRKKKGLLRRTAGERLRDELFKILGTREAARFLKVMDADGVLAEVIPQVRLMHHVKQGGYHHLDVWGHSLETVRKLEDVLEKMCSLHPDLPAYLEEPLAADRKRYQLMKLAALLHDIGKPEAFEVKAGKTMFHGHERIGRVICKDVTRRLKLATREREALDTLIFWHLRPGYLADNKVLTPRAVYRYLRDTGTEAVSVLLLAVADQRATRGPLASAANRRRHEKVAFDLTRRYFDKRKEKPFVRLINGHDLIKRLRLTPGPSFSGILASVEEAQVEGRVRTKAQALAWAKKAAARYASGETKREERT